ncbi:MAG: hypothetical protein KHZ77_02990 [Veillonella sp.]|uniref:hypothetical protein n=1 Tax=Veillonella sp. TaxID=1926307 RepID=UPI0025DA5510|nr:hypothetical protein [Veillonella sp.]MBS4913115.1 hypothetical protein [Veillonella sp.]
MNFKKLLVLGVAVSSLTAVASAKDLPTDQWYWYYSDADQTGRVLLDSVKYDVNTDVADVETSAVNPNTGLTEINYYKLNFTNNTLYLYQHDVYPNNSNDPVSVQNLEGRTSRVIQPNSMDAALKNVVANLVDRNQRLKEKPDTVLTPAQQQAKKVEDAKIANTWQNAKQQSNAELKQTDAIIENTDATTPVPQDENKKAAEERLINDNQTKTF